MNANVNLIKTQEDNINLINDLTDKNLKKIQENSLKKMKRSSVSYDIKGSKVLENGTLTSKTNMNMSIEKTIKALDLATNEAAAEIVEATADAADAAASSTINLANRIVNKSKQNDTKDLDKHKKDLIESVAEAAVATATAARVAAKISRIGSKLNGDQKDIKNYISEDDSTTEILRGRLDSITKEDSSCDDLNSELNSELNSKLTTKETKQNYDSNVEKDDKRDIGIDISGTINNEDYTKFETDIKKLNERVDKCVTKDELNTEITNEINENISNNETITRIKTDIENHQKYIQSMGEFIDEYEHVLPDLPEYYEKIKDNTKKINEIADFSVNYLTVNFTNLENKIKNCITKDELNTEIINKINENETIKTLQNNSQNYITKEYFEATLASVVTNLTNSLQTALTNSIETISTTLNTYNTKFTEITNQITENNKTYDSKINTLDERISKANTELLKQVMVDMTEVHETNDKCIEDMINLQKEYESKINKLISEANSALDEEINKKITSIIDSKIEISIKNRSILTEDCVDFLTKHYAGNLLKVTPTNVYIKPY